MPRFHFHVRDSNSLFEDLERAEYPDVDAPRADAVAASRGGLAERVKAERPLDGLQFEICDEAGRLVATVPIRADAGPA